MNAQWKRHAVLFLASQAVSIFGSTLVELAIIWHITLTTRSGAMMTLAVLCGVLPTVLISPLAGVWADRYSRRMVIALSDSLVALCTLVLVFLLRSGYDGLWLLLVASAVRAAGEGVQLPAVNAWLPQLVPQEYLARVNALLSMIQSATNLLAPLLSAALLAVASLELIFLADVVTAAVAVTILLLFLRWPEPRHRRPPKPAGYWHDLRSGLAYVAAHRYLKAFFLLGSLFFVLLGPVAYLSPLQVARSYGDEVWRLSALEMGYAVGMLAGGSLMATWGGFPNRLYDMALAVVVHGVGTFILGLPPSFSVYIALMGALGVMMPLFTTSATTLLQERVEEAYRGRVFSVHTLMSGTLMPLSVLVYGPLADVVSLELLMRLTGAGMAALGLAMLGSRPLLRAGRLEETAADGSKETADAEPRGERPHGQEAARNDQRDERAEKPDVGKPGPSSEADGDVCFVRLQDWLDVPARTLEPDEALAVLLERYLHAYGPATLQDFCYWSGVTVQRARKALTRLDGAVVEAGGRLSRRDEDARTGIAIGTARQGRGPRSLLYEGARILCGN